MAEQRRRDTQLVIDEAALAEVIEAAQEEHFRFDLPENGLSEAQEIAAAVAAWFKGGRE